MRISLCVWIKHPWESLYLTYLRYRSRKSPVKWMKVVTYKGYISDMATEWWTDKDWKEWGKKIERMKAEGTYGQRVVYYVGFMPHPNDDRTLSPPQGAALEHFSFDILDFSKPTSDGTEYRAGEKAPNLPWQDNPSPGTQPLQDGP